MNTDSSYHYNAFLRRANSKVRQESTKDVLLRKDEKLTALQERLEQKKAERLEFQQKQKTKPPKASIQHTRGLMREKVSYADFYDLFGFITNCGNALWENSNNALWEGFNDAFWDGFSIAFWDASSIVLLESAINRYLVDRF